MSTSLAQRAKYAHLKPGASFKLRAAALAHHGQAFNKVYRVLQVSRSTKDNPGFDDFFAGWQHAYEAAGLPFLVYDWEIEAA